MKFTDVVAHFGSQVAIAKALGVTPGLITQIKQSGDIPEHYQWKIQGITRGELMADKKYQPEDAA